MPVKTACLGQEELGHIGLVTGPKTLHLCSFKSVRDEAIEVSLYGRFKSFFINVYLFRLFYLASQVKARHDALYYILTPPFFFAKLSSSVNNFINCVSTLLSVHAAMIARCLARPPDWASFLFRKGDLSNEKFIGRPWFTHRCFCF